MSDNRWVPWNSANPPTPNEYDITLEWQDGERVVWTRWWDGATWPAGIPKSATVIAYRHRPAPYRPEDAMSDETTLTPEERATLEMFNPVGLTEPLYYIIRRLDRELVAARRMLTDCDTMRRAAEQQRDEARRDAIASCPACSALHRWHRPQGPDMPPPAPAKWICTGCGETGDGSPPFSHARTERDSAGYPVPVQCGPCVVDNQYPAPPAEKVCRWRFDDKAGYWLRPCDHTHHDRSAFDRGACARCGGRISVESPHG